MIRIPGLIVLLSITLTTGCGRGIASQGTATRSPDWVNARDHLGATVVLVSTSPNPDVSAAVCKYLHGCKDVQVVATRPAPCISDSAEIVRAAKQANAQTAIVLCFESWGYSPGPWEHGSAEYELRVLDARNGTTLFSADQKCQAYGRSQTEFDAEAGEVATWCLAAMMELPKPGTPDSPKAAHRRCNAQ